MNMRPMATAKIETPFQGADRRLHISVALVLALMCFLVSGGVVAEESIGSVRTTQGAAQLVRDGKAVPLTTGVELKKGDVLRTAENSSANVTLADGTRVIVGPSSQVSMDSFEFNSESQKGSMLVGLFKGTLRMISGAITKANPGQALIKTGTATVGLRGTDIIVEVP